MLDDAPWPPEPPEEPERKEHVWDLFKDVCAACGLTGEAYLVWPKTPCNRRAAQAANERLQVEVRRVRSLGYRRGPF